MTLEETKRKLEIEQLEIDQLVKFLLKLHDEESSAQYCRCGDGTVKGHSSIDTDLLIGLADSHTRQAQRIKDLENGIIKSDQDA